MIHCNMFKTPEEKLAKALRSTAALAIQTLESGMLRIMQEYCKQRKLDVRALAHDGLMTVYAPFPEHFYSGLSAEVAEKTGYVLRFTEKQMPPPDWAALKAEYITPAFKAYEMECKANPAGVHNRGAVAEPVLASAPVRVAPKRKYEELTEDDMMQMDSSEIEAHDQLLQQQREEELQQLEEQLVDESKQQEQQQQDKAAEEENSKLCSLLALGEVGLAKLMQHKFGDVVKNVAGDKNLAEFYAYSESTSIWQPCALSDMIAQQLQRMRPLVEGLLPAAVELAAKLKHAISQLKKRKQLVPAAMELEYVQAAQLQCSIESALKTLASRHGCEAVLGFCYSTLRDEAFANKINADPHALSVANGIVDLRTGKLRPRTQADCVTYALETEYSADHPGLAGPRSSLKNFTAPCTSHSSKAPADSASPFLLSITKCVRSSASYGSSAVASS